MRGAHQFPAWNGPRNVRPKAPPRHLAGFLFTVLFASSLSFSGDTVLGATYHRAAAATASPIATDIGIQVFSKGGNAVDASVAIGFALAVCHPEAGNIGGGGFAVIRDGKTEKVTTLDFREVAPSSAGPKMYLDSNGKVIENLSTFGARAVGVPGTVAGLHELWQKYGTIPWQTLISPVVSLADTGFVVDDYLANSLSDNYGALSRFPETRKHFFPGGTPLRAGDRLIRRDLAATLRIVAANPADFYTGKIAGEIVASMSAHGGSITKQDLEKYQPIWREPVHYTFDSVDFYSMAPPSSGGILVGYILKLLEPFDFSHFTPTSVPYIHLFCEAAKLAYADRAVYFGDPQFTRSPDWLLTEPYLRSRRARISADHATPTAEIMPGRPAASESSQTTHFSVCDSLGNMVAITYTLNTSYGCKLVVDGAGFLLNNEMDDFSIKPGVPNTYGLVGGEANQIEPGKRMLSSMAPTIALKNGRPFLVVGTPGGSKIITVVAEQILGVVRFHRPVTEVIGQPRFHHQWLPDKLQLEEASFAPGTKEDLEKIGQRVEKIPAWSDVQMIAVDSTGGMTPVSDPRGNGKAGGL